MALLVLITKECEADARTHSCAEEIAQLKKKIESSQALGRWETHMTPYLVKRKIAKRQHQLVARVCACGDHDVLVFLRTWIWASRDYATFRDDPAGYGARHLEPLIAQDALARRAAEADRAAAPLPKPSGRETSYLTEVVSLEASRDGGETVYESQAWIDATQAEPTRDFLSHLPDLLAGAARAAGPDGVIDCPVPGAPRLRAVARWFPEQRSLYLAALLWAPDESQVARARAGALLSRPSGDVGPEDLLRASRRSYPALLLADPELWLTVQKQREGNLALSPEEQEILGSLRAARHTTGCFPLFLNGRAGSGKTTLLHYIFADYLLHHLAGGGRGDPGPAYFTCSRDLLRSAHAAVTSLLTCGAGSLSLHESAEKCRSLVESRSAEVAGAFREFRSFLLGLLPEAERRRFPATGKVDLHRFRRLWEAKFGLERGARAKMGPDLSWHVVRSFVKGYDHADLMDPDGYAALGRDARSVSPETFDLVHDRVWTQWLEPLYRDGGLWDDQDVARALLASEADLPAFPAIVCDESQDLTHAEIDILFRLLVFSRRRMRPDEISRIPLILAGDEFQTLNPTGFRWAAIKSAFVARVVRALDPSARSGADLNCRDLRCNYRSAAPIVQVANAIQLFRSHLFDIPEIAPQSPWAPEGHGAAPMLLRPDAEVAAALSGQDVAWIVPCEEGEESAFHAADPWLRKVVPVEDGVPRNLFSPARAKGREFARVALYGFGSHMPPALAAALREGRPLDPMAPDRIEAEYALNRLYVAATRARRQLLVIDSLEGQRALWSAITEESVASLAGTRRRPEQWRGCCAAVAPGTPEAINAGAGAADFIEQARECQSRGMARGDSYLMRQASALYRAGGDTDAATLCLANAHRLDGDHPRAAEMFLAAGRPAEAARSLWLSGPPGPPALYAPDSPMAGTLEAELALVGQVKAPPPGRLAAVLARLRREIEAGSFPAEAADIYARAIREMIERAVAALPPDAAAEDRGDWAALFLEAEAIDGAGVHPGTVLLAEIAVRGGCHAEAMGIFERAGQTSARSYLIAKAGALPFPQNIPALAALGQMGAILDRLAEGDCDQFDPDQTAAMIDAADATGRWDDLLAPGIFFGPGHTARAVVSAAYERAPEVKQRAAAMAFAWNPPEPEHPDYRAATCPVTGRDLAGEPWFREIAPALAEVVRAALLRTVSQAMACDSPPPDPLRDALGIVAGPIRAARPLVQDLLMPRGLCGPGWLPPTAVALLVETCCPADEALAFYERHRALPPDARPEGFEEPFLRRRIEVIGWKQRAEKIAKKARVGRPDKKSIRHINEMPEDAVIDIDGEALFDEALGRIDGRDWSLPPRPGTGALLAHLDAARGGAPQPKAPEPREILSISGPLPGAGTPAAPAARPEPCEMIVGEFRMRWHPAVGRLNIEGPDGETLSVRVAEGSVSGDWRVGEPGPGVRVVVLPGAMGMRLEYAITPG